MDQKKIGNFIQKQRKEKKITQEELATKLGVTNRSVSKWENGNCMPDLSLFKPLCEELDITVAELLEGEKQTLKEGKEVEKTVMNLVDYSDKKIKKNTKKNIIISASIILVLTIIFLVALKIVRNNEKIERIAYGSDVRFPALIAVKEKEDGWVCHFDMEYMPGTVDTPYFYSYTCDNYKYDKISSYKPHGEESDANGKYKYEIETIHPSSIIFNKEYDKDLKNIDDFFKEKRFNTKISLEDLNNLALEKLDKEEILELYNEAIESKIITKWGNYANSNYQKVLFTSEREIDNYRFNVGAIIVMGHIKYINIEAINNNEYISDLIKDNKATEEQKEVYENIQKIEKYILEKQSFSLPDDLKDTRPYYFLADDIFKKINDKEKGLIKY